MKQKLSRSEAGRKGGLARAKQFTSASQRAARRKVSRESCARNGRLGAIATAQKYGYETLFRKSRKHRLNNPSRPERAMIEILEALGLEFEREFRLGTSFYTVDFKLKDSNKAIEVHGRIHRTVDPERRAERDARKRELMAETGIQWLYVTDIEVLDAIAVAEKVAEFAGCAPLPARPAPIDPDPECQTCGGKGYYRDSVGEDPIVKYDWVDCECRWRHLRKQEEEKEVYE